MTGSIHIFGHPEEHTTARYFERAIHRETDQHPSYRTERWDISTLHADDFLFFIDPVPDWPLGLERAPCLTVAYLIDLYSDIPSMLRFSNFFDVVFTAQKDCMSAFRKIGHKHAYWLPLACDPEMHPPLPVDRSIDVGFVGQLGMRGSRRHDTLSTILPRYLTNDFARFYTPSSMAEVYARSKIVLNASIRGDLNMRVFEALASGALLVTDRINNGLSELLEEGTHYVGYSSIEEAISKIDYYLANPDARIKIASAGHLAVIAQHTYRHRWQEILTKSSGISRTAPARDIPRRELRKLYAGIFCNLRMPWRIVEVAKQYGADREVCRGFAKAWGRWLNARIPLTPNAIRAKMRAPQAISDESN